MRGTASHHWGIKNETIDAKYTWKIDDKPKRSNKVSKFPGAVLFSITKACVALGVARSIVEEFHKWALSTQPLGSNYFIGEDAGVQIEYAKNVAKLESARSFLFDIVGKISDSSLTNEQVAEQDIAMGHLAAVNAGTEAYSCATSLIHLAGATATIYDNKPLQKKLRDLTTIRSHIALSNKIYEASGASMLDGTPSSVIPFWDMNYNSAD